MGRKRSLEPLIRETHRKDVWDRTETENQRSKAKKGTQLERGEIRQERDKNTVSRQLGKPGLYLGWEARRPAYPVLITWAIPAYMLTELDSMVFKE